MRHNPAFTAIAVVSLALGIGANTAIFSLFYTIVLRPLPIAHPAQLVELLENHPGEPRSSSYWEWQSFELFHNHNHVFSSLTGMSFDNLASVRRENAERESLIQENVLGNYFHVLGLIPALGRLIGPEDVPASGVGNVVVLSWSYWNSRFGRSPSVLGKRIFIGDESKIIIGIAPHTYTGPRVGARTDIWVPQEHRPFTILARLKTGVTLREAQAEADVLYRLVLKQRISQNGFVRLPATSIQVEPAGTGLVRVRDQYGKPLVLLIAIVSLLLLLACLNLASMLMARSSERQRELGVRVALGASRGRLIRQMLTESVMLSLAAALLGILFAYSATSLLIRILASGRAFEHIEIQVQPDPPLLLFTVAIALLTGLLFGMAPAWHAFWFAPSAHLRQSGKGGNIWFWNLFTKVLVTAQVALSVFLVAAAAMFIDHLSHLRNFDLGFHSDHVLLMTLDTNHSGYQAAQLAMFYKTLLPRLQALPGVRSASISGCTPLEGCGTPGRYMLAEGHVENPANRHRTGVTFVSPQYFNTLRIPILAGRDFMFQDTGRSRVVIINQSLARRFFPGVSPIGKHITIDRNSKPGWFGTSQPYEIVGLVGDVKSVEIRDPPRPSAYFNMFQENQVMDQFELRTSGDPAALAETVRRMIRDLLKTVPVTRVTTLADQVDSNIVPERLIATLSQLFGVLGAALAGIGLYGLLAYTVARRTNEVGIRVALGATPSDVSRLVLGDVLAMVCAGVLAGAFLVFASRPLIIHLIQDLKPEGAGPVGLASCVMVSIAVLAAYVPTRRAVRVDPILSLRQD